MLDRADCADFGCHNSIRLETKHFLNTLALTFISFSGRFVFAMQKHYLFFCERSSSFNLHWPLMYALTVPPTYSTGEDKVKHLTYKKLNYNKIFTVNALLELDKCNMKMH